MLSIFKCGTKINLSFISKNVPPLTSTKRFKPSSAEPSRYLSEIDKKLVEVVENKEVEDDDLPF